MVIMPFPLYLFCIFVNPIESSWRIQGVGVHVGAKVKREMSCEREEEKTDI